jgi:hypothetical protein
MSNALAVATVTAALKSILTARVQPDMPSASVKVTTLAPSEAAKDRTQTGINVYLYQVSPNPHWRNADAPSRRSDGTLVQKPQAALDLYYILSFLGDETKLEPQRLLGSTVKALATHPLLYRESIQAVVDAAQDEDDPYAFLATADLARQSELVRFTPVPMSLEEMSKLWSVFYQTAHLLSVAYVATVVFIEADETTRSALPVRGYRTYAEAIHQPVIEDVVNEDDAQAPISLSDTVLIRGKRLKAPNLRLRVGDATVTPEADDVSAKSIRLALLSDDLPLGTLRAGVVGVVAEYDRMMGDPETAHQGVSSNLAAFVLRPTITKDDDDDYEIEVDVEEDADDLHSGEISVSVEPPVGPDQRVDLILNELGAEEPVGYVFPARAREDDEDVVTFDVEGVKAGTYLVRVRVDGADSLLDVDDDEDSETYNMYVSPGVTIP